MKHNLLPALIVAAALLACGFIIRQAVTTSAGSQFDAVLTQLEESTKKKPDGTESRVTTIIKGFSRSVADGFKSGVNEAMAGGDQQNRTQSELKVRDALTMREVKTVYSQQKSQERVIGLFKNGSDATLTSVQLTILFKDKDGGLLDVDSAWVKGTLRPGEETAFDANRSLGDFKEKEEVLAQRKAASVVATVSSFNVVK